MSDRLSPQNGPDQARGDEILQLVGFHVGEQEFAVDILEVVGIERPENVLRLPRMPDFVAGVMRIRDEIVPLVKLRTRFGLPETEIDRMSRVLVVERQDDTIGFIVDSVSLVRRVRASALEPAPALALTDQSHYVRGVVRTDAGMVVLLDPQALLVADEARQLRSVVATAETSTALAV